MLGIVRELLLQNRGSWVDRIIPFAVEFVSDNVDGFEFVFRDLDASWIYVRIEFATDCQAGLRRCGGDLLNDHLVADQRLAAPVSGDVASSSANFCSSTFHKRTREPLLPPPSALISRQAAFG